MIGSKRERWTTSLVRNRRDAGLATAALGLILVLVFGPRMEHARIIFGIRFTTRTGAPGLTDLGLALLVMVPVTVYFAVRGLLGWLERRSEAGIDRRRGRGTHPSAGE